MQIGFSSLEGDCIQKLSTENRKLPSILVSSHSFFFLPVIFKNNIEYYRILSYRIFDPITRCLHVGWFWYDLDWLTFMMETVVHASQKMDFWTIYFYNFLFQTTVLTDWKETEVKLKNIPKHFHFSINILKWYYAQFSLQKFGCNCFLFQKIAIYNDGRQINDISCYEWRFKHI